MVRRVLRAGWLFRRGQKLAAQGHFDEAIEALHKRRDYAHAPLASTCTMRWPRGDVPVARGSAGSPAGYGFTACKSRAAHVLGRIYLDHADYTNAALWCARALALSPTNCHALALQALIELASGQLQQGFQHLQQPLPLPVSALERGFLWCSRSRVPTLLQQANAALQGRVLLHAETFLLQHGAPARTLAQQLLDTSATHNDDETFTDRLLTRLDWCLTRGIMSIQRLHYTAVCLPACQTDVAPAFCRLKTPPVTARQPLRRRCIRKWHSRSQACRTSRSGYVRCVIYKGSFARLSATCGTSSNSSLILTNQVPNSPCSSASCYARQDSTGKRCRPRQGWHQRRPRLSTMVLSGSVPATSRGTPGSTTLFIKAVQQLNPDIAALRLAEMSRVSQGRSCNT